MELIDFFKIFDEWHCGLNQLKKFNKIPVEWVLMENIYNKSKIRKDNNILNKLYKIKNVSLFIYAIIIY